MVAEPDTASAAAPAGRHRRPGTAGRAWALVAVPVAFFLLLELGLRVAGFGAMPPLVVPLRDYAGWMTPNPEVGRRWFRGSALVPGPAMDAFRGAKPEGGLRLVVQGGSSAAGFPYGHGGSFPRMLEQRLALTLPGREVEVINTGMDAVSSYALVDVVDEIAALEPDAVLVYAGHNEYYGALGVGSSISAGRARQLVRLVLALDRFRTMQLVRAAVERVTGLLYGAPRVDAPETTLMEALARDRTIEYGSDVFRAGVEQFEANLTDLACGYRDAGIPVFLATVVSNERDLPPLSPGPGVGVDETAWAAARDAAYAAAAALDSARAFGAMERWVALDSASAGSWYGTARLFDAADLREQAADAYARARDRDRLPFRAPSGMNDVIRSVADACGAELVDVHAAFVRVSPGGVPGASLLLEHVHPNVDGYFVMADAFYRALLESDLPVTWGRAVPAPAARGQVLVTALDSAIAYVHVRRLLSRWPFRTDPEPDTLRIDTEAGRLAVEVLRGTMDWSEATGRLGAWHEARGEYASALRAGLALAQEQPFRGAPLRVVAGVLTRMGRLEDALGYVVRSNRIERTPDGLRLEGQLLTRLGRPEDGVVRLEVARGRAPNDPGVLYDLAVAYLALDRLADARRVAEHLLAVRPGDPGALRLLERTAPPVR